MTTNLLRKHGRCPGGGLPAVDIVEDEFSHALPLPSAAVGVKDRASSSSAAKMYQSIYTLLCEKVDISSVEDFPVLNRQNVSQPPSRQGMKIPPLHHSIYKTIPDNLQQAVLAISNHGDILRFVPTKAQALWADFVSPIFDDYASARLRGDLLAMERDVLAFLLAPRVFQSLKPDRRDLFHVLRSRFDALAEFRTSLGSHILEPEHYVFDDEILPGSPPRRDDEADAFFDNLEDGIEMKLDESKEDLMAQHRNVNVLRYGKNISERVVAAVNSGRSAKAIEIILEDAHRPLTDNLLPALNALYPDPLPDKDVSPLPDDSPLLPVTPIVLQSILHSQESKASGPGPSGMVASHLGALSRFPRIFANLAGMLYDIVNGVLQSDVVHLLLTSGRGIPIISDINGRTKIRPLGPPEILFKVAALIASEPSRKSWPLFFAPIQFGVGAPGGAASAGLVTQLAFEKHSKSVVISADATAAFHSLDLKAAMDQLFAHPQFSSMWRWLHWVHSDPKVVVFQKESLERFIICMRRGGLQGDPLYPFFYSLALHSAYLNAIADSPSPLVATAYIDDFSVVGELSAAAAAMTKFEVAATALGLILNDKSNVLVHPDDETVKATAFEYARSKGWSFSDNSIEHLGRRLGCRNHLDDAWLHSEIGSSNRIFDFLKKDLVPKQIRFLLLKNVVVSKVSYLMRTTSPEVIDPFLFEFDQRALETFCTIFELDSTTISANVIAQIGLPVSKAGFGLFPTRDLADAAFVAAVVPIIDCAGPPSSPDDMITQFNNAKARLTSKGVSLPDDPSNAPKVQKQLSDQIHAHVFRELLSELNPVGKSRLLSASQDHAGYCLTHAPRSSSFRLSDDEFMTYGLMRLGLQSKMFGPPQLTCGACGQPLPSDPEERINHAMACTKTKKREGYFRHHHIELELRRTLLESAAFHVTNEPHFESNGRNLRPDLEAFYGGGRPTSLVEVSVTHPSCASYVKDFKSHLVPRASAKHREKEKTAKYRDIIGDRRFFTPAIAETYGALGPQLEKFVRFHSTIISRKTGTPYNRVVSNHFAAIAFALQRGNAQIIHRSLFHVLP